MPSKWCPLTAKIKMIMICIFWFVTFSTLVAYIRVGVIFFHQILKNRTGQPMQLVIQPDTFFCYARVFSCMFVLYRQTQCTVIGLQIMLMWFETVDRVRSGSTLTRGHKRSRIIHEIGQFCTAPSEHAIVYHWIDLCRYALNAAVPLLGWFHIAPGRQGHPNDGEKQSLFLFGQR